MKRISIITVCFNSEKTLEKTIKSVLQQSYSDIEYIIVDGGSTDNTLYIIEKYVVLYPGIIKYISEKDNGIYNAINKGIKMATGELIGILNSDDWYEPNAMQVISDVIPDKKYYVIYGMVRTINNDKEDSILFRSHQFINQRMIMHPATFVSKSIYDRFGLYDESFKSSGDYELFVRISRQKKIKYCPVYEIITNFRLGGMSSNPISIIEDGRIKKKYGYISQLEYMGYLFTSIIFKVKKKFDEKRKRV